MTQMSQAKKGMITPEISQVAQEERCGAEELATKVAKGEVVIPRNKQHPIPKVVGIGKGLRTKVNANLGSSTEQADLKLEVCKAETAARAGADTIMDLSTGGDLDAIRRAVMKATHLPIGTVPIYQAAIEAISETGALTRMTVDKIFQVLEKQAQDGVDFFTVHCGVTRQVFDRLKHQGRVMDIVSRGGAFLITWMVANDKENPLYEHFDRLLELARKYDITLSLGDGFRPGCLADATDRAQVEELIVLGELTKRAWEADVQVMIEGPGHIPLNEIETNVQMEKKLCHNAPFYVLGPVVTDIAPGYDHLVSAIGGALAAYAGADFLCYVTPGEHLRLPTPRDVWEGVIATRIAAHVADIAKGIPGATDWDLEISRARKKLDWDQQFRLAIDPELARRAREESYPKVSDVCTMCGQYCAIKVVEKALSKAR
ncbi:MAG: phosphomethylpyrimidine synthase ThiC [candidate division KSB1 bacterium]|nr:phosphomethylpyrimidine synthase ThiC [candidate division KSB1 bacterium]